MNSADIYGGGIHCYANTTPIIINTILWKDTAETGNEIYIYSGSSPTFSYCDIEGGWEGEGNIDADPLFRNPENDDFHLMAIECEDTLDSPCIDAGHPDIADSILNCDWGLGTLLSDMGAYGGGESLIIGIGGQIVKLPSRFAILQNYPNPFNAVTIIEYSLPEQSDVIIDIYDILGRRVDTLIDIEQFAGRYQVTWQAHDKSTGVYFYKIQAGGYSDTRKMILLK